MTPLANKVRPGEDSRGFYNKTSGAARGSVGVFTYDLSHNEFLATMKMAVMFCVPFDYNIYHHKYYAVGICDKDKPCDYNLYREMYYGDPTWFVRGEAGRPLNYGGDHIAIRATMTDNKLSTLTVDVVEL